MRLKRAALLTFLLMVVLIIGTGLWLRSQQRLYALNRQLIAALEQDDVRQALALVEAGADPNTRIDPPPKPSLFELLSQLLHRSPPSTPDSPTAFMFACGAGYERMNSGNPRHYALLDSPRLLPLMVAHGADVNAQSSYGWTALQGAIFHDRPRVVDLLLKHGARTDLLDPPLTMAVECSPDLPLIQVLLAHEGKVNVQNAQGQTPLMLAVPFSPDIVRLLLAHGAAVNTQDTAGNTVLHYTLDEHYDLDHDNIDIIRQLLGHGANPHLPNQAGETALSLAQHRKRPDIVALLKQARVGK